MASTDFVEINVNTDHLVDAPDKHLQSLMIRFPAKAMKISQIIKLKVAQEIHAYNERQTKSYGADYLSIEEYQDILDEGEEFFQRPLIHGKGKAEREVKHALRAYFDARFHVEFNGTVYTIKDATVVITENSIIRFVRLFDYE